MRSIVIKRAKWVRDDNGEWSSKLGRVIRRDRKEWWLYLNNSFNSLVGPYSTMRDAMKDARWFRKKSLQIKRNLKAEEAQS